MKALPQNIFRILGILLVFGFMIYTRGFAEAFVCMSALIVHEGSHMISASFLNLGLKLPRVAAFGLRFDTKHKIISVKKGVLLYLSGSLGNILLAVFVSILAQYIYIGEFEFFVFYNLVFAGINLIPAYPMDAARVLNCLLCLRMSEMRAVRISVYISRFIAYVMLISGIYVFLFTGENIFLMLMALTILISARKEILSVEALFLQREASRVMNITKT